MGEMLTMYPEELFVDVTELERRVANLLRIGVVAEADYSQAKARVRIGDLLTDWRPWLSACAGDDVAWRAPGIGEQVVMLSPSGDLEQGVILAGLYQRSNPPPSSDPAIHRTLYQDGAMVEYDRGSSRLTVRTPGEILVEAARTITITATEGVTLTCAAEVVLGSATGVTIAAPALAVAGAAGGGASPATSLQGNVTLEGNLSVKGNIEASGSIVDAGGNSNHHSHPR